MTASAVKAQQRVDEAGAEVVAARDLLAQWETRRQADAAAVDRLQRQLGAAALDGRVEEATQELQTARDHLAAAEAAVELQRVKVPPLERAYLLAVAELLEERDVAPARKAYDAQAAKVADLIAQIERLEGGVPGRFAPAYRDEINRLGPGESRTVKVPKSELLQRALRTAEQQVAVVRELADGGSPIPGSGYGAAADFPDLVWGPDAIVPAAWYLESVDHSRRELIDAERALDGLDAEYDRTFRGELAHRAPTRDEWMEPRRENLRDAIDSARARLEALGQPTPA